MARNNCEMVDVPPGERMTSPLSAFWNSAGIMTVSVTSVSWQTSEFLAAVDWSAEEMLSGSQIWPAATGPGRGGAGSDDMVYAPFPASPAASAEVTAARA